MEIPKSRCESGNSDLNGLDKTRGVEEKGREERKIRERGDYSSMVERSFVVRTVKCSSHFNRPESVEERKRKKGRKRKC